MQWLIIGVIVFWFCLSWGIWRMKMAYNRRLRKLWTCMTPSIRLVVLLLEPIRAFYHGWELIVLAVYASLTGQELKLLDDDHNELDW